MLLAALLASVMSGQLIEQSYIGLTLFLVVPLLGSYFVRHERLTFFVFSLGIQLAGWGLVQFRSDYGFTWIIWVILVVVVTDIAGYFAGRSFGGPKFWPRISPKKTWSGTVAGWVCAAGVGYCFTLGTQAGGTIIALSVVLSFASQMGDILESALKRRMKIKDSSTLIPGHGGLLDRFDGLLGATLFLLLIAYLFNVPGVKF